ncbi:MAG: serine/threonine-protein kinase, partial [Gemmatimonadetes bacterium]|nr:serine/threonine-protein kinase [Gemmatimonadota bacterium]
MAEFFERLKAALADRYRIEREIGAGGMATVYLAHDVKHDRKVAVKVLRPELSAIIGGERFLNEIKVTANLQHPNILPLYDSGEADSFLYYVMPYVEGETLRTKMDREKQLSVEETVEIAKAVAAALSYAHSHGVIHRDIKPENILLESGQAVVADFGIALAVSTAGGDRLTESGLSLGTPHYMSPEQAAGDREIDSRSDLYSLGAMVYEMLTGDRPHTGNTLQAIIAKVLTEDPTPITRTRSLVPTNVDAAVQRALAKTPADRFATASQFAEALSNPAFTIPTLATPASARPPAPLWARRSLANWHVALAVAMALAVGVMAGRAPGGDSAPMPGPVARFTVGVRLGDVDFGSGVALSPDAGQLVYVGPGERGGSRLFRRAMGESDAAPVAGTEGSLVMTPFLSPDGEMLGFYADQQLRVVPVTGGAARPLAPMSPTSGGGSWGPDNQIVYEPDFGSGLMVVSADGGDPRPLTVPDTAAGVLDHRWPHVLPGGKWVVLTIWRGTLDLASVGIASMETGEVRELLPGSDARYVDAGYLVYAVPEGALRAVRFDAKSGEVRGSPVTVLDSVFVGPDGAAQFAVSRNGTIAFLGSLGSRVPVIVDRAGKETLLQLDPGTYGAPRYAPNGRAVAMGYEGDVWIYDFDLGTFGPLTAGGGFYPLWTPDGSDILFSRTVGPDVNVFRVPADRAEEPVAILQARGQQRTQDLSPDGSQLMLRRNLVSPGRPAIAEQGASAGAGGRLGMAGGQYDLWSLALAEGAEPEPW